MIATLLTLPFPATFIGVSPGGVEWYAYRSEHAEIMRERLARLWRAHRRRVMLTIAQAGWVGDAISVLEDAKAISFAKTTFRSTYIEAPQEVLDAIADRIELELASVEDIGVHIEERYTETQAAFAIRSRVKSLRKLAAKLRGKRRGSQRGKSL